MDLKHLRYVIAVAEEGHITRAAERLGMQQPPLSRLIKAVEQEIKAQLFRRVPRGVELTEAGRAFLDGARATFANLDRTLEATRRTARGEEGRIAVGFTTSSAFHPLLPRVIREFRERCPLVAIALAEASPVDLIDRTESDQLDAVFIRAATASTQELVIHPLLEEAMVIALPDKHALAQNKDTSALPLKRLSDETFVVYRRHGSTSQWQWLQNSVVAACHAAGFNPRIGQEAPHIISTLPLVAAGLGISIVPASLQQMNIRGVAYRRLKGPTQLKAPLSLASRRGDTSAVVRQFLKLATQTAKKLQPD